MRAYAEERSETAFAELARRHVDFVFSAALRMVRDPHRAEDVSQAVFLTLAQNARRLTEYRVLSGWLHRTAQNLAANVVRSDVRRKTREQKAATMNELLSSPPDVSWADIAPELDNGLAALNDPDRDALLLRYFEDKSAQEMAEILGISDEAAQKRVNRAVDKLRYYFSKRNVTVGASGLVVLISANAVKSAPLPLSAMISSASFLPAAQTSTVIAATKALAMTTIQKATIAAVLGVVAGAGIYEGHKAAQLQVQVQSLQQQQAPLAEQLQRAHRERDAAVSNASSLAQQIAGIKKDDAELLRLRSEVTQLRRDSRELAALKSGRSPTAAADSPEAQLLERVRLLKERLEQTPAAKIPEMQYLTEQDWLTAAKESKVATDDDFKKDFSDLRSRAEGKFLDSAADALRKYMGTNNGAFPTEVSQLKPYFENPPGDDILDRYKIVPASSIPQANMSGDSSGWLITLKSPDSDALWFMNQNGAGASSPGDEMAILAPALKAAMDAATRINGNKKVSMQDLEQYLTTPEQKAAYARLTHQGGSGAP